MTDKAQSISIATYFKTHYEEIVQLVREGHQAMHGPCPQEACQNGMTHYPGNQSPRITMTRQRDTTTYINSTYVDSALIGTLVAF